MGKKLTEKTVNEKMFANKKSDIKS